MKRLTYSILALICLTLLFACQDEKDAPLPNGIYAQFLTDHGEIICRLEYQKVPMTVGNFVALAEGTMENTFKGAGEPFFDGLTFHRVVSNFMIQGGDPQGNGQGGPGYAFKDEFEPSLLHNVAGTLSMANAGPATNGSQFFITHTATPHLDNRHSVFGYVVRGLKTVYMVQAGDTIRGVNIIRQGADAEAFDAVAKFNELK